MNPIPLMRTITLNKWKYGIQLLLQSSNSSLLIEKIREWRFYVVKTKEHNKFLLVTLRNNIVVDEITCTYNNELLYCSGEPVYTTDVCEEPLYSYSNTNEPVHNDH